MSTSIVPHPLSKTSSALLASYSCHLRPFNQPCAPDRLLDETIQVKARNAVEAERLAHLATDKAVIDVVRLDD